ncbi:MAG: aldo/keto reductase [Planctomycetota bacterium]|nr:MAG: aldo/keto reductase [Planctomycetota bacterium]
MQTRRLGRSSLELPVVTFGAWAIGGGPYWNGTDDEQALAALAAAFDAGMHAVDTAPIYGMGHSETIVGRALAAQRRANGSTSDIKVCTKIGLRWDCDDGELFFESQSADGKPLAVYRNSRPESVRLECERSLQRLGVDHIHLLQVHWPDPTTPVSDTMGALAELHAEGKIGAIGVSNYDPELLEEAQVALGDLPLASTQPKYSLVAREIEADVLPWVIEHEVGVLAYSPLEQGLLTGKVRGDRSFADTEGRARRPSFQDRNRQAVNALLDEVVAPIAAELGASLAQTVIAWTVARPGISSALVGARTPEQARENAAAGELQIPPEAWSRIDTAFAALRLESEPV